MPSPPTSSVRLGLNVFENASRPENDVGAAALHLDRDDLAASAHDEVHLVVVFAPVEQLTSTAGGGVREVSSGRRLGKAARNSLSERASSGERPDCAVMSAVFSICSLGLDPRWRRALPAYFWRPVSMPAPASNSR
jgi:hypothetical protein